MPHLETENFLSGFCPIHRLPSQAYPLKELMRKMNGCLKPKSIFNLDFPVATSWQGKDDGIKNCNWS
jgi:hypothetical protein